MEEEGGRRREVGEGESKVKPIQKGEGKKALQKKALQKKALQKKAKGRRRIKEYRRNRTYMYNLYNYSLFLPDFLIDASKMLPTSAIKVGEPYQKPIQQAVQYEHISRPLEPLWQAQSGKRDPLRSFFAGHVKGDARDAGGKERVPEEDVRKFKAILGERRTQEELIRMYRIHRKSWSELLLYIEENKVELKKIIGKERGR